MIRSMTGYAHGEHQEGEVIASVEMRSVNHRFCEVSVRMPRSHAALEERVKECVRRVVSRGHVDVFVDVRAQNQAVETFAADVPLACAYEEAVSKIRHALGLKEETPLASLLREEGILTRRQAAPDLERDWICLCRAVDGAAAALVVMREKEGASLHEDFSKRLDALWHMIDGIEKMASALPKAVKERFEQRIRALLAETVTVDEARVAQEAAFLADRGDITEEITRARSHISQFRGLMDAAEPAGRSLNFLVQELLREFSTMGAKSASAALSHAVVQAKAEVEKLREQIQNVE